MYFDKPTLCGAKELKKYNLTHTQFVILSVIAYLEKSSRFISQVDISALSNIDAMTVSTSLKTLSKNGYVITTSCIEDSRANTSALTMNGKEVQLSAIQIVEDIDDHFLEMRILIWNFF